MSTDTSWNPTNDPTVARALTAVWGHCASIERGTTPDEWRASFGAAEVLELLDAHRAQICAGLRRENADRERS